MKKYYKGLYFDIREYVIRHIVASIMSIIVIICSIATPICLKGIIDYGINDKNLNVLFHYCAFFFSLIIVQVFFTYISTMIFRLISRDYTVKTKNKVLNIIQTMNGKDLAFINLGKLRNIVDNDIEIISSMITNYVLNIMRDIIQSISVFFIMIFMDYKLTIVVLLMQLILALSNKKLSRKVKNANDAYIDYTDQRSLFLQEYFTNLLYIISANYGKYFKKKFSTIESETQEKRISSFSWSLLNANIGTVVNGMCTLLIYGYGGYQVIKGTMSFGTLYAFTLYSGRFISPILRLSEMVLDVQEIKLAIKRVYSLLNYRKDEENIYNALTNRKPNKYNITFKNVCFSYNAEEILKNVEFSVEEKEVLAIIGYSGSGKSTLINLLTRMWNVNSGEIMLGDSNIQDYNIGDLRNLISVVSQQKEIFHMTILENLLMGQNIDMERVVNVTKKIEIYDFIMSLPEKFDTILATGGTNISEGQKQRIAICRAILKESKILVFDEATSNIDYATEIIIKNNLLDLLDSRTLIIISHKRALVELADTVLVLDEGQVVELGTKENLIELEKYYKLFFEEGEVVNDRNM